MEVLNYFKGQEKLTQRERDTQRERETIKTLRESNFNVLCSYQKKRHPNTQGVYRGIQGVLIKYKNYINQVNPKLKKNVGFSTLTTNPIRF